MRARRPGTFWVRPRSLLPSRDYEIIRIAHEIGKRGLSGMSFICIPPGSALVYRVIVYVIMYLLAGLAIGRGAPTPTERQVTLP